MGDSEIMEPLPKYRNIKALDLAILLFNVFLASKDTEAVGWHDPNNTLQTFVRRLNKPLRVTSHDLESALYCCNMLNEHGKFWHPFGKSCEKFAGELSSPHHFNPNYNFIQLEKEEYEKESNDESKEN